MSKRWRTWQTSCLINRRHPPSPQFPHAASMCLRWTASAPAAHQTAPNTRQIGDPPHPVGSVVKAPEKTAPHFRSFARGTGQCPCGPQGPRKAGVTHTSILATGPRPAIPHAPIQKTRQPPKATECSRRIDLSHRLALLSYFFSRYRGSSLGDPSLRVA
jgi:hypothetical protein